MRDIRFRAKDAKTGEWVYGYYAVQHIPNFIIKDNKEVVDGYTDVPSIFNDEPGKRNGSYWHEIDPNTLGQYTGMHDMCDKELWEGDLIKYKHDRFAHPLEYFAEHGKFVARNEKLDEWLFYGPWMCTKVGNKYDNTNLMGKEL